MTDTIRIPLFPLGVVLLPDMSMPLHIFEERYKQMIGECLTENKTFGLVLFDGQAIRPVGCMARITNVLKRYDDDRMDIMIRGEERFVIRELIQQRAYLQARVFFFDDARDDAGAETGLDALVEHALNLAREAVDVGIDTIHDGFGGRYDPKQLAFTIAALEGFTPAERQGFLEMTSPVERLEKCVQVFSRIVKRNRLTKEIQQMIKGNGHPAKSILRELGDQSLEP